MRATGVRAISIAAYRAHGPAMQPQELAIVRYLARCTSAPTRAQIAAGTGLRVASVCGRCRALLDRLVLAETPARRCEETGRLAHGLRLASVQAELFA